MAPQSRFELSCFVVRLLIWKLSKLSRLYRPNSPKTTTGNERHGTETGTEAETETEQNIPEQSGAEQSRAEQNGTERNENGTEWNETETEWNGRTEKNRNINRMEGSEMTPQNKTN